jgi:microcystin-dependent protein
MDEALGQLLLFAGDFVPKGYLACNGQTIAPTSNTNLYELIGTAFGGDGTSTFGMPNLPPVAAGNGASMNWAIATDGTWPDNGVYGVTGQVRPFPFPVLAGSVLQTTWLPCDGSLIHIQNYEMLFAVLGTTFGGDGQTNFAMPKIAPLKSSNGTALPWYICATGIFPQMGCNPASPGGGDEYYDIMMGSVCQVAMAPSVVNRLCQFALCNGQTLPLVQNWYALYSLVGAAYGPASSTVFSLPNIPTGADKVTYLLATEGYYPSRD